MVRRIRSVLMRGGTSRGLFFHERDLPSDANLVERFLLAAYGSPDPFRRQTDGVGGGASQTSKAAIIRPAAAAGYDVVYRFGQVAIEGLGLGQGAWKPVQEETPPAVLRAESFGDDADDHLVRDQKPAVEEVLGPHSERSPFPDGRAEDVTGGDVRNAVPRREELGLRALAGARGPQEDQIQRISLQFRSPTHPPAFGHPL